MNLETFLFIANSSTASALLAILIGLTRLAFLSRELKLLLILAGVSFTCDMAALFHNELGISVNYFGDTYRLAEFILLLILYYKVFNNPKWFWIFLSLALSCILFFFFNVIFLQQEKINSYSDSISACVFIVLAVLFLYKLMKDLPTLEVYRLPMFWVNVAVLLYFAGNLFLFIISNYLVTVLKDKLLIYWTFHNFLGITKNILFAVGFYMSFRLSKKPL